MITDKQLNEQFASIADSTQTTAQLSAEILNGDNNTHTLTSQIVSLITQQNLILTGMYGELMALRQRMPEAPKD